MALVNCLECNAIISNQANSCPQCGIPINNHLSNTNQFGTIVSSIIKSSFFFSSEGRISRLQYAIALILIVITSVIFSVSQAAIVHGIEKNFNCSYDYNSGVCDSLIYIFLFITTIPFVILIITGLVNTSIKRLHDMGKNGYYVLTLFIPIIGIFTTIWIIFTEGENQSNQYGLKPCENFNKQQNTFINTSHSESKLELVEFKKGLWSDPTTNLMWSRISLGQKWINDNYAGSAQEFSWSEAENICKNFKLAEYDDWRLPTLEELKTIILENNQGFKCPDDILLKPRHNTYGIYWSSSSIDYSSAWCISFHYGKYFNYGKVNTFYVRPVRNIKN